MRENFGKLHRLVEEVKKQSKNNSSDSQMNGNTNGIGEKAENVIENIETNLNKLGVGFKKKTQPKRHNHFDKMHETTENEHFSITINQAENSKLSTLQEKEGGAYDQEKTNTHDMIDDDKEPNNSNESPINPQNDSSITKIISDDHLEDRVNGTDPVGQLENDSVENDKDDIPHSQVKSSNEPADSNTDPEERSSEPEDDISETGSEDEKSDKPAGDTSHPIKEPADSNTEPGDGSSEHEDDISETSSEDEKSDKPAGDASHPINEPADSNTEPGDGSNEHEDDISETGDEDEKGDENERLKDDFSLEDSTKDPSDELLDEEGIDDVGKYAKKRHMVLRKNSS